MNTTEDLTAEQVDATLEHYDTLDPAIQRLVTARLARNAGRLADRVRELEDACRVALARMRDALDIRVRLTGLPGGKLAKEVAQLEKAIASATTDT